jgi:hypothetical protein
MAVKILNGYLLATILGREVAEVAEPAPQIALGAQIHVEMRGKGRCSHSDIPGSTGGGFSTPIAQNNRLARR